MKKYLAGFFLFFLPLSAISDARDPGMIAFEQQDYTSALSNWAPRATAGDLDAQFKLGYLYEHGLGTTKSTTMAKFWYSLSAHQGSAVAQHYLATLHHDSEEYTTAVGWYVSSAEQGVAEAQADLAASYGLGEGIEQNYVYAYMWSSIASSNGNAEAKRLSSGIAEFMSIEDISLAQFLAKECVAKKYKNCGNLPLDQVLLALD